MKIIHTLAALVALATGTVLVDAAYRTGKAGQWDYLLATMRGWSTIEDENPKVIEGLIPGMYTVVVEDGTVYDVNLSAEPELRALLDRLADEQK